MKLDKDYIQKILEAVEECEHSSLSMGKICKEIGVDLNDPVQLDKFHYHMKRVDEYGFLTTGFKDFGFSHYIGGMSPVIDTEYELTLSGHEYLDDRRSQ